MIERRLANFVIAAATLFAGLTASVTNVFADETESQDSGDSSISMQISPVSNRVTIKAGSETIYLFKVTNNSPESLKFKVYTSPYNVVGEEYNVNFTDETNRTQISRWISFRAAGTEDAFSKEATFSIGAKESQLIEYKITVPNDIPSGGQYATIVTEYVPSGATSDSTGVNTIPRVNMLIYGSTSGDTVDKATILEHNLSGFLTEGNIDLSTRVANEGNTDFSAVVDFQVGGLFGGTIYERSESYDVLPDTVRRIEMEWENTPMFGLYFVTTKVTANDQVSEVSKIVLKIPLFLLIILLIFFVAFVIWAIILIRNRTTHKRKLV